MRIQLPQKSRRRRRAMTLVEVLIGLSISSAISLAAISTMMLVHRGTTEAFWHNQSANQARHVADLIVRDIQSAVSLEAAYGPYQASADTLILRVPSIGEDEDALNVATTFDRIIYRPAEPGSKVLIRQVMSHDLSLRPPTTEVVGDLMSGSSFEGTFAAFADALGAYVIHYRFTMSHTLRDKTYRTPISGSVRLRNKL